jgi:hypothetical protein
MNDTFIINADGQIEQINYNELVWRFVDITTTPCGVAPRFHVRKKIWFKVGNDLFDQEALAQDAADDAEQDAGTRPAIEEVVRFEGWTWGHQGNFQKQIQVFDTQEEADEWIFKGAETDFQNDCNTPMTFNNQAEAEAFLKERE